jgi:hypothetical protein
LPEVVGSGPFPPIQKLAAVERVLLAGLANIRARSVTEAVDGVAAAAVGLQKCDMDTLRRRLIALAVERASAELDSSVSPATRPSADESFAARAKQVAEQLTTPPFQGRVAIAQVYDAYGRIHPDASSLASFKARLVEAAKARTLVLGRLDLHKGCLANCASAAKRHGVATKFTSSSQHGSSRDDTRRCVFKPTR